MPAPKTPNTEAARAVKAANARQRKINDAKQTLWELGGPLLTRDDAAELLQRNADYRESGLGAYLRGYFGLPESLE